jgi:DNA-binding transcriptional ArsR family regulator
MLSLHDTVEEPMSHDNLTSVASLISDPTRAEILLALMDGRAFPASDLASIAHVSPSTASYHLANLVQGGLVEVFESGRHRYHRLAGHEVAELLESMGSLGKPASRRLSPKAIALGDCRTCYDHLAGRLGVELRISLVARGLLTEDGSGFKLSENGSRFFKEFGVDVLDLRTSKRTFAKACLDWTERLPHIGGALGSAIFHRLLERGWIARGEIPRKIVVTPIGAKCLYEAFGLDPLAKLA